MSAIAPVGDGDADRVVALWRAAGLTRPWNNPAADLARARAGPTSAVLASRDVTGALTGTIKVGHDGHRGWLYYLAVAPERRGEGRGRALVAAAEAWLAARGVPKVQLMVRGDNPAARGFYAAIGYAREDVTVLSRRLNDEG